MRTVNGLLERIQKGRSDEIFRRVGKHDVTDRTALFELDRLQSDQSTQRRPLSRSLGNA